MTEYFVGKKMETLKDFLDAPIGLIIKHNSFSAQYIREENSWVSLSDPTFCVAVSHSNNYFSMYDGTYNPSVYWVSYVPYTTTNSQTEPTTQEIPPRSEILREAEGLITGDRNISYGSPTENFSNISEMWTTRLKHKLKDGEKITGVDLADMMVLLKVARNIANPKRDNFVDGAGYFACGYEIFLNGQ